MKPTRVRIQRILCPTDFSEFAARALRHAAALARHFDARLHVLHVTPLPVAYGGEAAFLTSPSLLDNPEQRQRLEADLRAFVVSAIGAELQTELALGEGLPWRQIKSFAEDLSADLLVMGTHGRGGFERLMLGSVTEKLLLSVACPVLTVCREEGVRLEATALPSRILCATDLGPTSEHTIAFALSLAAESQAKLTFLHVVESVPRPTAGGYPPLLEIGPLSRDLKALAAGELAKAVSDEARAWCELSERVETGRAWESILQVAAEERVELIVMGSHARAIGSALFGSTAQHVVRAAACPVLTVRAARAPGELALAG
jgi:nucleotide-binding universal stress UspA family protein